MLIKTTFTVYGQFTETDVTSATCTFNSNGTYLLTEDDYGTLRYYPGTFHLNKKGTKIFFTLDKAARKAIKLSLTDWLEEIAWDNGYDIGGINFRLEQVTLYSAQISAVTNQPTKAIVEISGKVSAYVDGVYTMKDFYRKTVVKFLYRL